MPLAINWAEEARITGRGIVQLMRIVPLSIWSVPTILFGFFFRRRVDAHWALPLALALAGALLLQGLITHGLNDLYDWQSGTDKASPGIISGGSKVLNQGLMNPKGMLLVVMGAVIIYGIDASAMAMARGWSVLAWGLAGLAGSVGYSLPPFRLSYRAGIGEWAALFPAMASGVVLGSLAADPRLDGRVMLAATWYGVFCVASVMQHHFADMEADWASAPPKHTTPAFWRYALKRSPKEPVLAYEILALGLAMAGSIHAARWFLPCAAASLAAMAVTVTTPLEGSVSVLTRRDLAIKALVPVVLVAVIGLRVG